MSAAEKATAEGRGVAGNRSGDILIRLAADARALAAERRLLPHGAEARLPDGRALLAFSGKINLASVPSTVVLGAEGRVAAVISGPVPGRTTLVDVIDEVADSSPASSPGTGGGSTGG